jgi:3',5'-cyclic AMP phosphodiesterase CpdA
MRIIQISDLHIGGLFKQDSFDTLVDEINNDLKPDVLIISGDLTDEGVYFQYEKAKKELSRFLSKNMIVFPGNHDYRHTGYLLFPQFFPDVGESIDPKVHTYRHPENSNLKILITIVGTAVADRDEGEVGESQNLWLNGVLKEDKKIDDNSIPEDSSSKNTIKIVAMHHHLIAIPDTGYTKVVGISDAGDVLRTCLANNVDLIICGHKHRPWLWDFGQMKIAYAGTACSWRYRGVFEDTYNIIDIEKDGVLKVDIKIVGGDRMPLSDVVSRYDPDVRVTRIADLMSPD